MRNSILLMQLIGGSYTNESEYKNLSNEEKQNIDYVNICLSDNNLDFEDACTHLMLLVLDVASKLNTPNEQSFEEVQKEKDKILDKFAESDKDRLNAFLYACINSIGIYSEDRVKERKEMNKLCQK